MVKRNHQKGQLKKRQNQKNYSKHNQRRFTKHGHNKTNGPKKGEKSHLAKKFQHIQRNQEVEDYQKRCREMEMNYKQKMEELENTSDEEESGIDVNPLDQLLSTFQGNAVVKKSTAIESSDSEIDDNDDENIDEIEEMNDENVPLSPAEYLSDEEAAENVVNTDRSIDGDSEEEKDIFDKETISKELDDIEEFSEEEIEIAPDDEFEEENGELIEQDVFQQHLNYDLSADMLENISSTIGVNTKKCILKWSRLKNLQIEIPTTKNESKFESKSKKVKLSLLDDDVSYAKEGDDPKLFSYKSINLENNFVKDQLIENISYANRVTLEKTTKHNTKLTDLQCEVFSILNNYQDFYMTDRTLANGEELRLVYCLHALNHMLKTRSKIINHNTKLAKQSNDSSNVNQIISDNYRDQGLVRPKVLILVPFRNSALKTVQMIASLLFGEDQAGKVIHYNRFAEEYGGETIYFPKKNPKPEDYELTFTGNTDDTFRIGISLTKKAMRLYTEFYSSDILIASPLGLRMIIGAPGDQHRDYDFLTSLEMLILDQSNIFLSQNWEHLLHVFEHLHLQPKSAQNTDFGRVRSWCLNGWSKFYRQTLIFASNDLPEFRSLINKCTNYRGKIRHINEIKLGSIRHCAINVPQVFHKVEVSSIESSFDQRFDHFVNKILSQYKSPSTAHCMIYVPSYFDYVRLRNYFKKESVNFCQICEYTKDSKMARARDMFFHSGAHFMLYSERAHFFRRTRIKGIRNIIFYQPPTWPNFYSEIINFMHESNQNPRDGLENSMSIIVMYTKYDILQLAGLIGTESAAKLNRSTKATHMFITNPN